MADRQITEVKLKATPQGGHMFLTLWTRTLPTETWALCGSLTFDNDEWPRLRNQLPPKWAVEVIKVEGPT